MSIYLIYRISVIIVSCLKKGCLHEYIIYISYIIYNRMFVYCLERKKRMSTWVYHSYLIYHLSSFVCPLLKKMYTWVYPLYIIIIWFIIVCQSIAWKKRCIHEYILYILCIIYHRLLLQKRDVYMSISFTCHISFIIICLSIAWKIDVYMSISFIHNLSSFVYCLNKGMYAWFYPLYMMYHL